VSRVARAPKALGRVALLTLLFALACAAPAAASDVYVANWGSHNVSQYDAGADGALAAKPTPTVPAGNQPNDVAVSPDGKSVYVANRAAASVSQYDVGAGGALAAKVPATVRAGITPEAVAVSPDGKSVYVTNANSDTVSDTVSQYDVGAGGALAAKATATVPAGDGPNGIAVSPDGTSAYVVNEWTEDVSQYDVGADGALAPKATPTVPAGPPENGTRVAPRDVAVSPDGKSVYVANATNTVSQYDVGADGALAAKATATVPTGERPNAIAVSPDGKSVYVANQAGGLVFLGSVSQYDVGAGGALAAKAPATVPAGNSPFGIAVSPNGKSVYVANTSSDNISQYDVGAGGALAAKAPATVPAGNSPFGIAVSPNGKSVYVANTSSDNISQYDVGAGGALAAKVAATVPAGKFPTGIAVSPSPPNSPPVAGDDAYTMIEDTLLSELAPGVLGNDEDAEGDALTAALVSGPAHGTLTLNPNGSFAYAPNPDYNGSDSFTYKANDGSLDSNTATVSIDVTAVNDTPTAADDPYVTDEDTPLTVDAPGVLGNDSDAEGVALTAALVSGPAHGTLTLNPNGSFAYAPNPDYNGSDSFTYKANDGSLDSNTATVTLTVNAVNDAPSAADDSNSIDEDTPLTVAAPGVLDNDSDPDGDTLMAVLVSGPAHGTLAPNADGSFDYTPAANFNGSDSFTYRASDGSLESNIAKVSITVTPVNDAPLARVVSGGTCSAAAAAATLKLSVTDPDTGANPTLSATSSNPTIATAAIVGSSANPTVTITGRKAGTATVTIKADDGAGGITSEAVTVWVGSNGAETITGDAGSDLLFGVNGRDTLSGAGGADYICSGNGHGTAAGGDGDDTIHGQNGDDVLRGEAGNDVLTGDRGADRFSGGPGTDTATDLTPSQGDTQDGTIP
jgi:large repetitive protein